MPKTSKLTDKLVSSLTPQNETYDVWDTEIKGFTIRISPTGNKSFRLIYRLNGTRKAFTIGKFGTLSSAQAREIAKQKAGSVANGVDVQDEKLTAREAALNQPKVPTLQEFIEDTYNDWRLAHKKDAEQSLARLKACFYKTFGNTRLDAITTLNIEEWRTARLKAGLAHSTVNRDLNEFRALFTKAVEWRILASSPLDDVTDGKTDKSANVRFLDKQEFIRLREALATRDNELEEFTAKANAKRLQENKPLLPVPKFYHYGDHLTPMVLLSVCTGIRQGELFALEWDHVDLTQRVLTVNGDNAKSSQTRHVPLNKEAYSVLSNWQQQTGNESGLVFKNKKGQKFDNTQTSWDNLREKANLEDFRWHDLRHTFASLLVMAGVDLNTVRELLGHSDIKMTLRYAHLAPGHKAKAVALLDLDSAAI